MTEKLVVTRHPALVDLLLERGLVDKDTRVVSHASAEEVRDKHVYGVLPLHLAAEAAFVTEVPLALTPEMRGKELDLETLREVAGEEVVYAVDKLPF